MTDVFIGIDVGSGSVRAAAFFPNYLNLQPIVKCSPLDIFSPRHDYYEQSSVQIWTSVCAAVKELVAALDKQCSVRGIGFDATCSLVVLDQEGNPLSVSPTEPQGASQVWNVIMWMDHRAMKQADFINDKGHNVLRYVGDVISPESEPPKLMWLKEHRADTWAKAGHFMDLADFLTYKATKSLSRSLCTTVCKWLFQANPQRKQWDASFWQQIGLADLCENNFEKVGNCMLPPGTKCGLLSEEAAKQLGLSPGIAVSAGIIDAHAGAVGALATSFYLSQREPDISEQLAMIAGTSTCHMALCTQPLFVPGIWGPFYEVLGMPDIWLNEAGQSAVGSVLDMLIHQYGGGPAADMFRQPGEVKEGGNVVTVADCHRNILEWIKKMDDDPEFIKEQTRNIHVWPDYHGNRSPFANPKLKGAIIGLDLISYDKGSQGEKQNLLKVYLAHIQAFAFETRLIMEKLEERGHSFSSLTVCGGLQKNSLYVQAHADILQKKVLVPNSDETVALGAAILASVASGGYSDTYEAMKHLGVAGTVYKPNEQFKEFYEKKYAVFKRLGEFVQTAID